jgi:hypothetical protein
VRIFNLYQNNDVHTPIARLTKRDGIKENVRAYERAGKGKGSRRRDGLNQKSTPLPPFNFNPQLSGAAFAQTHNKLKQTDQSREGHKVKKKSERKRGHRTARAHARAVKFNSYVN